MKIQASKILFVSSFPPTRCGIATFTTDLMQALSQKFSQSFTPESCELASEENLISKPAFSFNPKNKKEYAQIAQKINQAMEISLVHIQHEFGLFSGEYGENLFDFLDILNKPVVFTFHTVLPEPNARLREVVNKLASYASGIFVMTCKSVEILEQEYDINPELLHYVPHGTHLVKWVEKRKIKARFDLEKRTVLSTFGLLGPGKSIETALKALPQIIEFEPSILYLIIGKTHPNLIKNGKDEYGDFLKRQVKVLNLEKHVIFVEKYVELPDLLRLLQASDIYLFTSKDPNQAVSGTFSYALSCGCPIIATSVAHTRETLNPDLGIIIPIEDHEQLARATISLIADKNRRKQMSRNATVYTLASAWENVAIKHARLYQEIIQAQPVLEFDLPAIKLSHLFKMTSRYGILQFSKFSKPDPESGYTLDDNARALIAMIRYYKIFRKEKVIKYMRIYLKFIERCQKPEGNFVNYIDIDNKVHIKNDYVNLEDSNGRAIWALGECMSAGALLPKDLTNKAWKIFKNTEAWLAGFMSPRAAAFAIKGLYLIDKNQKSSEFILKIDQLASHLITRYDLNRERSWNWFEENMTYANSILPEALLYAYLATGDVAYKKVARESFDFLLSKIFVDGQFRVISNRGWYHKNTQPNLYGEQPIDVFTTVQSLGLFYQETGRLKYKSFMQKAFNWFLGDNHLNQIIYNPATGGCFDGLEAKNVNINQGAESSICYLLARLLMENLKNSEDLTTQDFPVPEFKKGGYDRKSRRSKFAEDFKSSLSPKDPRYQ